MTLELKDKIRQKPVLENYLSLMTVPTELFSPCRMLIMQDLAGNRIVEHRQLKYSIPGITDGNLASHIRALQQAGFLQTEKEIVERKIRTSYELTDKGLSAYKKLITALTFFIKQDGSCNE